MNPDINNFGRTSFLTHTTGLVERIEKMTEQELLAVLDMSEDEQFKWLMDNDIVTSEYVKCSRHLILADLAFRLRDEVNNGKMHEAMYLVQQNVKDAPDVLDYATAFWGLYHAKPIHWIIAALIAKEK